MMSLGVLGVAAVLAYALGRWFPMVVAGWVGRRHGIETVPAAAWAVAARVDTVLLDRWGTVTTGRLTVTGVEPLDPEHLRSLRWFAGALEHEAEGPLARAVARLSPRGKVTDFAVVPGSGVRGSVDRHPVRVGRPSWVGMADRTDRGVTLGVELDGRPLGHLVVGDELRPDAVASVTRLGSLGVAPELVSDDTASNTEQLAGDCGIERWHPELAPEKRELLVTELQERGRVVALVSSREADEPAQATADLAVGGASAGDVRLTDLDVARVALLLSLARGVVSGTRWAGLGGLVPAAAGAVPVAFGVGGLPVAGGLGLLCLVCSAGVAAVAVIRKLSST